MVFKCQEDSFLKEVEPQYRWINHQMHNKMIWKKLFLHTFSLHRKWSYAKRPCWRQQKRFTASMWCLKIQFCFPRVAVRSVGQPQIDTRMKCPTNTNNSLLYKYAAMRSRQTEWQRGGWCEAQRKGCHSFCGQRCTAVCSRRNGGRKSELGPSSWSYATAFG